MNIKVTAAEIVKWTLCAAISYILFVIADSVLPQDMIVTKGIMAAIFVFYFVVVPVLVCLKGIYKLFKLLNRIINEGNSKDNGYK